MRRRNEDPPGWEEVEVVDHYALVDDDRAVVEVPTDAWGPAVDLLWENRWKVWSRALLPGGVLTACTLPVGTASMLLLPTRPEVGLPLAMFTVVCALVIALRMRGDLTSDLAEVWHGARRADGDRGPAGATTLAVGAVAIAATYVCANAVGSLVHLLTHGGGGVLTTAIAWLVALPVAGAVHGLLWPAVYLAVEYDRGPVRSMLNSARVTGPRASTWVTLGVQVQALMTLSLLPGWLCMQDVARHGLNVPAGIVLAVVGAWTLVAVPWTLALGELVFVAAWQRDAMGAAVARA
jgi:hypothetical protein